MASQNADEYRARATQARRIADRMNNCQAQIELRKMAAALDEEADCLQRDGLPMPTPPPARSE